MKEKQEYNPTENNLKDKTIWFVGERVIYRDNWDKTSEKIKEISCSVKDFISLESVSFQGSVIPSKLHPGTRFQ